ncbi:MAG: LacI family transcriptional regulator [Bacteroidales bacterium]|jgi:DNA-binding LacI/PurR family transcriptional regulator|nr:LacI family transcriptional regulator [Bacteroidales bacterium]
MKYTIDDIAHELNLSKSTVSRALHDSYQISPKTKEKVFRLAEQWGFQFNPHAQGLKIRRSFTLGVVVPEIAHKYFSSAISGIQEEILPAGYYVLIGQSNDSAEQEQAVVKQLIAGCVDGLIISLSATTHRTDYLKTLVKEQFPVIMFDRVSDDVNCSKVIIDHTKAAYTATEHLIRKGCRRIAHLSGLQIMSIAKNRIKGYKQALNDYGLPFVPEMLIENGVNADNTPAHIRNLMQRTDAPDGISCFNDDVAIHALLTLKELHVNVPQQVKIIGFNNEKECEIIEPKLSSVEHPVVQMGKKAARLFLNQISGEKNNIQTVIFDTSLIERASTA